MEERPGGIEEHDLDGGHDEMLSVESLEFLALKLKFHDLFFLRTTTVY